MTRADFDDSGVGPEYVSADRVRVNQSDRTADREVSTNTFVNTVQVEERRLPVLEAREDTDHQNDLETGTVALA